MRLKNFAFGRIRRRCGPCGGQPDAAPAELAALHGAADAMVEPLDFVRDAVHVHWRRVGRRVNAICAESGLALKAPRPAAVAAAAWGTLLDRIGVAPLRASIYLYDERDVLRLIQGLVDPNYAPGGAAARAAAAWCTVQVPLAVPGVAELRRAFGALHVSIPQVGVEGDDTAFPAQWEAEGQAVLAGGLAAEAQAYLRRGAPGGLRPELWLRVLCPCATDGDLMRSRDLRAEVAQYELLFDRIVAAESVRLAAADDNYFVFEELIKETLLVFLRDETMCERVAGPHHPPPMGVGGGDGQTTAQCPPSGIVPPKGVGLYVAPLCFMYDDPAALYLVFSEMYARYFSQLHAVSSAPQSILLLSAVFERLLQAHQPQLVLHLRSLGLDPLALALPWLCSAFVGHLPPAQVLLLWDRIVGFDSLLVLPITAAAIFSFRRGALLGAKSAKDVERLLKDVVMLNSTALLQYVLFGGSEAAN